MYFCFIDYAKTSDCVNHSKVQKVFKDHLTFLLRNLYESQEETEQAMEQLSH